MPGHTGAHGGDKKDKDTNKGDRKGTHGGRDPQQISASQIQEAANTVAAGGANPYGGGNFGGNNKQTTTTTPTTETPDDDTEYTSSIIDALFTGKTYKKQTQAEKIKEQIANLQPRFQNQLLSKLSPLGITNLDQLTDAALTQAYDEGNISFDELKESLLDPDTYIQGLYAQSIGGLPTIGAAAVPLKMGQFMYDVFTDQPANLNAAMGPFDVNLAPYQGPVTNFNPDQMQDLADLQGGITNTQIGQSIQGTLGQAETQKATRGPQSIYVPPSGVSVSALPEGSVGLGDPAGQQIDFSAIYNSMNEAQKATIDKITELPEYDLPYGIRYIQQGGPLF
jgi:hypothetical protein